jgi:outer membrane protein OmpA-like peptidoglycan-associated protein
MTLALLSASLLIPTGCATKKFVRERVSESDTKTTARIGEVEKNTKDQITSLDEKRQTDVSRLDELVKTADNRAGQAMQEAGKAGQRAEEAARQATESGQKAQEAITAAAAANSKVDSLADLKMVASDSILFRFDSAALTDEEMAKLDALAEKAKGKFHTIEVHGFTDKVGDKSYNMQLSQQRAQAVARYLAQKHEIPLHRIQLLGFGPGQVESSEEMKARERNRLSRRVEIRVFAPEGGDKQTQTVGSL